ncbi:MAG: hypothetical protein GTO63_23390 [Anaerolineae bacterium]|nr:hypothetical protein [Anaerolineae bacterium]NIN97686.1 hypothetical protein [Anaerolineae bacterium]NIQ80669.1 hypothetical protein [Anaerolineae bacterium]
MEQHILRATWERRERPADTVAILGQLGGIQCPAGILGCSGAKGRRAHKDDTTTITAYCGKGAEG